VSRHNVDDVEVVHEIVEQWGGIGGMANFRRDNEGHATTRL
jgi:hypothetical protein